MMPERWKEVRKAIRKLERKGWRVCESQLNVSISDGTQVTLVLQYDPQRPEDVL